MRFEKERDEKQNKWVPLKIVPSRPSFLGHDLGTRCDGAYSTIALNWAPGITQHTVTLCNSCNMYTLAHTLTQNHHARVKDKKGTKRNVTTKRREVRHNSTKHESFIIKYSKIKWK